MNDFMGQGLQAEIDEGRCQSWETRHSPCIESENGGLECGRGARIEEHSTCPGRRRASETL